jgi:hypothetical protein
MEDGLQVDAVYTDFSNAFDRVNHGLLLGTLTRKFCRPMIFWVGFYLIGRTQRVRLGNNLSETIYCYFGVTQGSHIGPLFLIADINDVLDSFEIFAHSLAFFSYSPFFQRPASFLSTRCFRFSIFGLSF